jgi:glucose/arabinose dehydrogenase
LEPWASGLSSPSGLAEGPRGALYVTEEGSGGRVSRLDKDGKATVLATGLGKAREVILLDPFTLLVSDRAGGAIYQIALPRPDESAPVGAAPTPATPVPPPTP